MLINPRNAQTRRNRAWLYPLVAITIAGLVVTVLFASAHRSIATGEDEETATSTPTLTPRPDKYQDGQDVLPQSDGATGTTGAPTNLSLQLTSLGNGYYRMDFSWNMDLCKSCGSDYHRVGMDSRWLSSRLYSDVSSYTDYGEYLAPGQHSWFVIYRNRSNSKGGNQYTSIYRSFTIAAPTATPTITAIPTSSDNQSAKTNSDETTCYYPKLDSRLNYLACKYDAWIAAGKPKSEVDIELPIGIAISFTDYKKVVDYLEQNGLRKGIDFYIADWQPNAIYAIYISWHALGGLAKLPGVERVTYNALPIYDTENDIAGQTSTESDAAKWHGADEWHRANLNGQGVKVGVIDSNFSGFQSRQGEGNETKRRSRSAANERHARISVNSRSRKSTSMSASDIPDAKYSKTS